MRAHIPDSLHNQGRAAACRNLLKLPSFLHRKAKTGGYGGPRRTLHEEIRESCGGSTSHQRRQQEQKEVTLATPSFAIHSLRGDVEYCVTHGLAPDDVFAAGQ